MVYGTRYSGCNDFYVGKTKRHLTTRFKEHKDLRNSSAVTQHIKTTGHDVLFDDVKILANGKTDLELLIKETLIIKQLKPTLNANA